MALLTVNGGIETLADETQRVITNNTGTWDDLTTWDSWNGYVNQPNTLNWLSEVVNLGSPEYFTLEITADCVGVVTYTVYTSTTGVFGGEETVTTVNEGDTDVAGFYGQYCIIGITVDGQGRVPAINSFDFTASTQRLTFVLNDINSTTLSGTDANRTLVLPQTVSNIANIQITPHITDNYTVESYVADDYFETGGLLLGSIVSKDRSAPGIRLSDLSGNSTSGVFDAVVYALPQQYMNGQNLALR